MKISRTEGAAPQPENAPQQKPSTPAKAAAPSAAPVGQGSRQAMWQERRATQAGTTQPARPAAAQPAARAAQPANPAVPRPTAPATPKAAPAAPAAAPKAAPAAPARPQPAPTAPAAPKAAQPAAAEPDAGPEILARRPVMGEMHAVKPKPAQPAPEQAPEAPQASAKAARMTRKKARPQPEEEDYLAYDSEEDGEEVYTGRPRWHAPVGCLLLLIIIGLVAFGAWQVSRLYREVSGASEHGEEQEFVVEQGALVADIAKDLQAAGFIEHDWLFRYYTQYSGKQNGVQFGTHILRTGMSYNEILDSLSEQVERRQTVRLTFPEGTTAVGIGQILEENGLCTVAEFLDCANGTDGSDFSKYDFWNAIPDNPGRLLKCEGYLFPNTYDFYTDASVYEIVDTFYREFDRQISDLMDAVKASGSTLDEIVILASIVQEEAGFTQGDEALLVNKRVAACFYNRLHSSDAKWSAHQIESNACSDITNDGDNNYLWNSPMATYMGWRDAGAIPEEVLAAYDTYHHVSGLPAGAISNPGRTAIEAAIAPDQQYIDEGYFFFVTGHPDTDVAGQYFFAKTADEHSSNVIKAGWG